MHGLSLRALLREAMRSLGRPAKSVLPPEIAGAWTDGTIGSKVREGVRPRQG